VPSLEADELERDLRGLYEAVDRGVPACRVAEAAPLPQPAPDTAFNEAIDNRGELQVTLLWVGQDDLDLEIVCPSTQLIAFPPEKRSGCGGVLDIDANANPGSMRDPPVENITFETGPGEPGQYRVLVHHFKSRTHSYPVPFRVRVRDGRGERIVEGQLERPDQRELVTTFTK
jgi:hypothetical protein